MESQAYVYILTNKKNGTLYIGVTHYLVQRIWQHKNNIIDGVTQKYNLHRLVYFECHLDIASAIQREKQMKKWNRVWKVQLIEQNNPGWLDLWGEINR